MSIGYGYAYKSVFIDYMCYTILNYCVLYSLKKIIENDKLV